MFKYTTSARSIIPLFVIFFGFFISYTEVSATVCTSGSVCTGGTGTWVAPAGVTSVTAETWGGGGAGAGETANNDGGQSAGGGGAYSKKLNVTVVPGNSYTVTIGAAGVASTGAGTAGGDSWFCNATTNCATINGTAVQSGAKGGGGGSLNTTNGIGGAAASGFGDTKFSGGDGGDGGILGIGSGGGGGSAGSTGSGGNGGNGSLATGGTAGAAGSGGGAAGAAGRSTGGNGNAGSAPGGGGSGAYVNNNTNRSGGAGTAGQVILWYTTVSNVSSSLADGSYKAGQVVPITVTFSQAVTVAGTPQITLETGTIDQAVNYSSGSGSTILTFNYTVQAGDTSADLDYVSTSSLALNGGTITNAAGGSAVLTLPTVGGASSIAGQKAIVIDTTAPAAPGTPDMTAATDSGSSNTDNITSDTTPDFTISCETAATVTLYDDTTSVGSGTCVSSTVTITSSALSQGTHASMNAKQTDVAGNISAASGNLSITIDTTVPTLSSRSISSNNTNSTQAKVGNIVTLSFTASETIGTPTVTFRSGGAIVVGSVTTSNPSGNNWTASYTTQSGDTEGSVTFTIDFNDTAGNAGTQVTTTTDSSSVTFDKTAPFISQVTAVPSPTNDSTPNYTFQGLESGTITYGGDCSSVTSSFPGGSITITFNALADGTHSNCTITVTDAAGNASNILSVNTFIIDTVDPTLVEVTPVPSLTPDNTPNYTFSSTEAGTITYGGDCSSATTSATNGNNTITFNTLSDGAHSNCTITVTDAAGNGSLDLAVSTFTVDTSAPTLAEVTPVTTPTTDTTPNYTFSTTQAGTITYGGSCSSATTSASSGNNTITFNALVDGTYTNCTIKVTDDATNDSNTLTVTSFTIDTTAPVLAEVTPVTTPTSDTTPDYTFSSTEAGTITYGGSCSSATTSATSGNNTITFNTLADGTYTNCTIRVTDTASNQSNLLTVTSFTVDTTAPTLTEVTPISSPTSDSTPNYVFNSDEAGTITYGGDCSSATTSATVGNNTITFNALTDGTHSNCTITVTDAIANVSNILAVASFVVDTTAPVLAEVTPVSTPTSDTTPDYTFNTNEAGTISYSGDCSSVTTSATVGNNTITFNTLTDGTHSNCMIEVTDVVSNTSTALTVSSFTVDTSAPTLAEVTPVTTPTTDTTPNYTFSTTQAGTITYGGSCSSATTSAAAGNNTITFGALTDGTYTNCTIKVTDDATNDSNTLTVTSFTIDTTAPVLAEVTPVTTPTSDTTPDYTFSSDEAGTITYGGDCSSSTTSAIVGNNTITFNTLSNGTHSNCTITVTDSAGNGSLDLTVSTFIVDTSAPVVAEVTSVTTPTTDTTPDYTFSSTEAGTITYGGDCSSATTSATSGNNTITFNTLADGTHSNCTITVTDAIANVSNILAVTSFVIDTTAPVLAEVTPVVTPTGDTTPNYTFSSTEAGTITYGGSCTSATAAAVSGNNTISFETLAEGTYSDCTIIVTDSLSHASDTLAVTAFTIATVPPAVRFVIIDPSDSVAGTPVTVTIHALRSDDSIDTDFQNDVTLAATGSATGAGLVDITNGIGTIEINDVVAETVLLSLVDTESTGLDVTSTQSVVFAPTIAVVSKFVILDPADVVIRRPATITIRALKTDDTIDTSYQQDVTLLTSGAATGAGLVDIIDGIGTITITDAVVETVTLVLSDTQATGLDTSSTQEIIFRRGGGTQAPPTLVRFTGRAYPDARFSVLTKDKDQLVDTEVQSDIISSRDGVFSVTLTELPIKLNKTYGIAITDADGRRSQTKFYTLEILPEKTVSKTIFAPPTIGAVRSVVAKQGTVELVGYMTPKNDLLFELDGKEFSAKPVIESSGFYSFTISAERLTPGTHTVRVKQQDGSGITSDSSLAATFTISDFVPETDLNGDGAVTISDWSIFLLIWGSDDADRKKGIDFNHDGRITVSDLSIFIQTMK